MNQLKGKVLIAAPVHYILTEWLSANGYECITNEKINQSLALDTVNEYVGIITSTRLTINKELIDKATNLQWIGRMGSGMEIIDTEYADYKGIKCYSSPEGNSNAVAEHALGMLLALNKKIIVSNQQIKEGLWIRDGNRGIELDGKTIGIIGFGHTGRAFAKKLRGFDVQILAYDKYDKQNFPKDIENCNDLEPIFERADVVSFHVPHLDETYHYFDDAFLSKMKKPFILVNTSRGNVVDLRTLLIGLESGDIAGTCLDVYEQEPIDKMNDDMKGVINSIMNMQNAVLTPHIAGYSVEALYKMSKTLLGKIVITE